MTDRTEAFLEDRVASLFQPDVLISAQYFDTIRSKTGMEAEKRLMLAVLEDALRCFQDNVLERNDAKKELFADAEEWFLSEGDDWAFSFENICDALGLNPEYVRAGLLRWKEKRLAKPAQPKSWAKDIMRRKNHENSATAAGHGFSLVPLLLAEKELPTDARRALLENRLQDAAETLMRSYGLSCVEASQLLNVAAC
jgi:hypothetical protein